MPGSAISDEIEWLHGSHKEQLRRCATSQLISTPRGSFRLKSSWACDVLTCRISWDVDPFSHTRQSPLTQPCNHENPEQQAQSQQRLHGMQADAARRWHTMWIALNALC